MTTNLPNWTATLVHLLALASRLEGEGQYNLAKLARGAADSLSRQAAYRVAVPTATEALAADIKQTAEALAALGVGAEVVSAMTQGADVMANGGVPLIALIPHPHVCRTCGHLLLGEPTTNCSTCGAWPGTYQRFMPNYWFDALEPPAALARLRQTPLDVAALLEGLSEAQLNQTPADGGWAIRNALTHLRDAQDVLAFRLDLFLAHEHPVLEAKAVWTWAANEQERPPTALEIFEAYQASRADALDKLTQLPLADWWRTGRHEEFGEVTLRQQVSYFTAHELTHLSQIASLRVAGERALRLEPVLAPPDQVGGGSSTPNLIGGHTDNAGGTWTNASGRALKTDFAAVDRTALLEALAELPITSWSHRAEDPALRHLGPTAEDFYAAFGLGAGDGASIGTVDADGVALATIQALYQLVLAQQAQLAEQQQRIEALEARLALPAQAMQAAR